MKLNETKTLPNGWTITITKNACDYDVYLASATDEPTIPAFTGSLLECRAYAKARLEGKHNGEAKKAARTALEKKNSRPTEAQKAHELGMTIREYREFRRANKTNQSKEVKSAVEEAVKKAAANGLDLSVERMMLEVRVDLETGEVTETLRTAEEAAKETELWAKLWNDSVGGVVIGRVA